MQRISTPQEMAELELALEKARRVPAFRTLLLLFWGLIVAKCLLAQWASQVYGAPINTFWFVWVPSFMISGAITLGYAYWLFRELPHMPLNGRLVSATWAACATGFGVLALVATFGHAFSVYLLPAEGAVLLGVGCLIHSALDRRAVFKYSAAGWWLSAFWLFAHNGVDALAWMSLALMLFLVAPAGWVYWHRAQPAFIIPPGPPESARPPPVSANRPDAV
jgi:hypothetical protein